MVQRRGSHTPRSTGAIRLRSSGSNNAMRLDGGRDTVKSTPIGDLAGGCRPSVEPPVHLDSAVERDAVPCPRLALTSTAALPRGCRCRSFPSLSTRRQQLLAMGSG